MCIIIDACTLSEVFPRPPQVAGGDFAPVVAWLRNNGEDGRLVYGGTQYLRELAEVTTAWKALEGLKKAGRAHLVDCAAVDDEAVKVGQLGILRSNDSHIIALARVSGARTLCTAEEKGRLQKDFGDRRLVPTPKGKVYRRAEHASDTLTHTPGCPAWRELKQAKKRR